MTLTPNYYIGIGKFILLAILFFVIMTCISFYSTGKFWIHDYWFTILILFFIFPTIICIMFVPQHIILNNTGFSIKFFLRKHRYISFHDIHAYGMVGLIFCIQPNIGSTLQIYKWCFTKKQIDAFFDFIGFKCPGKKAWFWIGPWAIR